MYSYADRIRAVELYIKLGLRVRATIRQLCNNAHQKLRVGDVIQISGQHNHFPLVETASHSVLVAGGIGITPVLAMLRRRDALCRTAHL